MVLEPIARRLRTHLRTNGRNTIGVVQDRQRARRSAAGTGSAACACRARSEYTAVENSDLLALVQHRSRASWRRHLAVLCFLACRRLVADADTV